MRKYRLIQAIVFYLVSLFSTRAQAPFHLYPNPVSNTTNIVYPDFNLDNRIDKAELFLTLYVGETEYNYGQLAFEYTVAFDIQAKTADGVVIQGVFGNTRQTLVVNSNKPSVLFYKDFTAFTTSSPIGKIELSNINIVSNTPLAAAIKTQIENALYMKVDYSFKNATDIKQSGSTLPAIALVKISSSAVTNRTVPFSWTNGGHQYPNYQFQLLRLRNTNSASTDETNITAEIDWTKALTLETESSTPAITVNIAEGTGFYLWRVRPIGTYYEGGIANPQNWGPWNTSSPSGGSSSFSLNACLYWNDCPSFFYRDVDDDKNWVYSRTFSEQNKKSEQIIYANGLQQVKQSQTYMQSNQKTLVSGTVPDNSGRPALNTLPVPVSGNLSGYKNNFVAKPDGNLFTADDYDKDINYKTPSILSPQSGTFDYYSGNTERVPNAQGYPYSRTIFYNDGTNRVKEQAGPGLAHSLGSNVNQNHTSKTFYDTPSEDELIRLFGDETPDASKVLRTVSVDENNTTSITYSSSGKVIATCLSFNPNESAALAPLDAANDPQLNIPVNQKLTHNVNTEQGFVVSKRLAFTEPTALRIDYNINCDQLTAGCLSAGCKYQVVIKIINIDYPDDATKSFTSGPLDVCGSNGSQIGPLTYALSAGTYIVEKTLVPAGTSPVVNTGGATDAEGFAALIKSWLGQVHSDADLDAFYTRVEGFPGTVTPAEQSTYFPINGMPSAVLDINRDMMTNKPVSLTLNTACCPGITIPLENEPAFSCSGTGPDFTGYAKQVLGLDDNGLLARLPGYSSLTQFNQLINNMLTDQYSCTSVSGCPVPGLETGGDVPSGAQYTCENLWKCWINVVSTYNDMISADAGINGSKTVESGVDSESGSGSAFDDQFDNNDGGGLIVKWLAGAALHSKGRGQATTFNYNMAAQFMECAGYKFGTINIVSSLPAGMPDQDFISNRTQAYKTFDYVAGSNPACEKQFAFNPSTVTEPTPCEPYICAEGYSSWTCSKRKAFYECIKNQAPNQLTDPYPASQPSCPSSAELDAIAQVNRTTCYQSCEDKRAKFKDRLIIAFTNRCYTIDGCASSLNAVPMADIDAMADAMVTNCRNQCYLDVPTCTIENCGEYKYVKLHYNNCLQLEMQQAQFWDFQLDIAPAPGGCATNSGALICNDGNSPANQCPGTPGVPTTGNYSVTKTINVTR